jgi:hypothetical protein
MKGTNRPPYAAGDPRAKAAGRKGGAVTADQRRARSGPWNGTILDLLDAADMTGPDWIGWRAFWAATYALPLSAEELAVFQRHTKRAVPPAEPVDEAWMIIGRGAGKTRNAALHAVFRAITFDSAAVSGGESVSIPLLASDRDQAGAALKYVRAFNALPVVAPYVHRGTLAQRCEYRTGVDIQITTASFKAPRGRTAPTACLDEIAFWHDEGSNPDHEILTAIRGTLGRVRGSLLVVLSNPYSPRGELHRASEQYFGRATESEEDGVLVWNSDTLGMRPSHPPRPIARLWKADPVKAGSEYGADGFVSFRQGQQALLDEEPLRVVTVKGRRELSPITGIRYTAFVDVAEGARSGDSMTLGVAHNASGRAVLDLIREVQPPFNPAEVIKGTFAPLLLDYGCQTVQGDRHAVGFVADAFAKCGVKFVVSPHTKSDLYSELLPLVNAGSVELLDLPSLRAQLLGLERRSARGGNDSIDHQRGGHDDVANAAAGALVHVTGVGAKKRKRVLFSFGDRVHAAERPEGEALGRLIKATHRRLDAQAKRDWKREQAGAGSGAFLRPEWD